MAYVVHPWVRISQLILGDGRSQYTGVTERELRPTAGSNYFNPNGQMSFLTAPSKEPHSERPRLRGWHRSLWNQKVRRDRALRLCSRRTLPYY